MLRDQSLIPLSRQHQHALALCVRLDRAMPIKAGDLEAWQAEIQQIFEQEISIHFAAEEKELFPVAERFAELRSLIEELRVEHAKLREFFAGAAARSLDAAALKNFGETLSAHIRKEERQLFEGMQRVMSAQELAALAPVLDRELADASNACILPSEATRLRPKA
ncbi:MAG: hemerythrin domain-containing protein [Acidobacteriia bacterium]|nr:hemerythrin domain-containing protein [Terriglobia bacterium]